MGLGSYRWRLAIILITAVLLWQTSKIWLALLEDDAAAQEFEMKHAVTSSNDPAQQKVDVVVYYEALCPDSRSFILKQLLPTYKKMPTRLEIGLVPYGKAKTVKTNDGYEFVCQHGPIECQANIIHACSIDIVKDPSIQLDFLACMIENNMNPMEIMNTCAESVSVDVESIKKCSETDKGKELLAEYGKMTSSLRPRVVFIPTITLDKSSENQVGILKNLLKEVCLHFKIAPKECTS